MTHTLNFQTAYPSLSKCKRKTRRTTPSPKRHQAISTCAQCGWPPPSPAGSDPTKDQTKTPPSQPSGVSTELTISHQHNHMKDVIAAIGKDVLHIKKLEIGMHSIRSGAAMAMFLSDCSVCQIMMIGRWSSDAFLRYIRKQVEQFSYNVSKRMTTQMFHQHIPTYTTPAVSNLYPRQRNNLNNVETRRNVGGNMTRQAIPPFALYH